MNKKNSLASIDSNENFWSLGCILGVSIGIPGMLIGSDLAKNEGILVAITNIFLSHLILWILGLGIISMTEGKNHAIENIKKQFGKWPASLSALIFGIVFLMWFTRQLSGTSIVLNHIVQISPFKIGIGLGGLIVLLSLGGLKILKWICIGSAPILIGLSIYFTTDKINSYKYGDLSQFSYFNLLPILISWLPGVLNLPTFFRHSKSKGNSIIALSIIMGFHICFQILMIFSGIDFSFLSSNIIDKPGIYQIIFILFSIISLVCINLTNTYFASACWEMLFPKDYGVKKLVIFSLIGTSVFGCLRFVQNSKYFVEIENLISYSITLLLLSLLTNFLISIAVKHRFRNLSRFTGTMAWVLGCLVMIIAFVQNPEDSNQAILNGCVGSILFSLAFVFLEESVWAIKCVNQKK